MEVCGETSLVDGAGQHPGSELCSVSVNQLSAPAWGSFRCGCNEIKTLWDKKKRRKKEPLFYTFPRRRKAAKSEIKHPTHCVRICSKSHGERAQFLLFWWLRSLWGDINYCIAQTLLASMLPIKGSSCFQALVTAVRPVQTEPPRKNIVTVVCCDKCGSCSTEHQRSMPELMSRCNYVGCNPFRPTLMVCRHFESFRRSYWSSISSCAPVKEEIWRRFILTLYFWMFWRNLLACIFFLFIYHWNKVLCDLHSSVNTHKNCRAVAYSGRERIYSPLISDAPSSYLEPIQDVQGANHKYMSTKETQFQLKEPLNCIVPGLLKSWFWK